MDADIKRFIEKNIGFIEAEAYDELYEQAYEWLSDDQCKELTDLLTATLGEDFNEIAKSVALSHLEIELNNFAKENMSLLSLPSIIRLFMNHICGVDYFEFRSYVCANLNSTKSVKLHIDNSGELFFEKVKR